MVARSKEGKYGVRGLYTILCLSKPNNGLEPLRVSVTGPKLVCRRCGKDEDDEKNEEKTADRMREPAIKGEMK
jgi:hypothetical protein